MKKMKVALASIIGVIVLVFIVFMFFTARIPTGYTGIVTIFGQVSDTTLEAGLHVKNPFAQVVLMDNREQRLAFNTQSFSSDIQQVVVQGSVNYSINKSTAMTLFKEVGREYSNLLITPRLLENTKAVFSKYSAERLVADRELLSIAIRDALKAEMDRYGITIISLSIEDIDFTDAFTDAVEAKQVAEQTKLKVETEEAQKIAVAEAEAKRRIIAAEADAKERALLSEADLEVAKKLADAEAYAITQKALSQAEANRIVAESLTEELIEYTKAVQWDGKNPTTVLGGDTVTVITP